MDPKRIVQTGYDEIVERYVEWASDTRIEERERYTSTILDKLPPRAKVLDLGCGSGLPTTSRLAERFDVLGVDLSQRQIDSARMNVPSAHFICSDMDALKFPDASFDGIAAFYSIISQTNSTNGI